MANDKRHFSEVVTYNHINIQSVHCSLYYYNHCSQMWKILANGW